MVSSKSANMICKSFSSLLVLLLESPPRLLFTLFSSLISFTTFSNRCKPELNFSIEFNLLKFCNISTSSLECKSMKELKQISRRKTFFSASVLASRKVSRIRKIEFDNNQLILDLRNPLSPPASRRSFLTPRNPIIPMQGIEMSESGDVAHRHSMRASRCTTAVFSSILNERKEATVACCTREEMHSQTEVVKYRSFSTFSLSSEYSSVPVPVSDAAAAASAMERDKF